MCTKSDSGGWSAGSRRRYSPALRQRINVFIVVLGLDPRLTRFMVNWVCFVDCCTHSGKGYSYTDGLTAARETHQRQHRSHNILLLTSEALSMFTRSSSKRLLVGHNLAFDSTRICVICLNQMLLECCIL